jgi:hypothetical protein
MRNGRNQESESETLSKWANSLIFIQPGKTYDVARGIRLCWELTDEPCVGAESVSETGIEFGLKFGRTMGDLQEDYGRLVRN